MSVLADWKPWWHSSALMGTTQSGIGVKNQEKTDEMGVFLLECLKQEAEEYIGGK